MPTVLIKLRMPCPLCVNFNRQHYSGPPLTVKEAVADCQVHWTALWALVSAEGFFVELDARGI